MANKKKAAKQKENLSNNKKSSKKKATLTSSTAKQTSRKQTKQRKSPDIKLPKKAVSNDELKALLKQESEAVALSLTKKVMSRHSWLRWLLGCLAVLVLAIFAGGLWFYSYLKASLPPQEGSLPVKFLKKEATIARDAYGIPRISAKSEEDLFFATGYAMASDRLWQMAFLHLMATGRTAELLGEKTLPLDIYLRTVGLKRYGDKIYQALPPEYKNLLASFAAGVNEYLRTAKKLPIEFLLTGYSMEEWRPENSIHLYLFFNFSLATNHIEEASFLHLAAQLGYEKATYLFPTYPDEPLPFAEAFKLKDIPYQELLAAAGALKAQQLLAEEWRSFSLPASNNWAVHPQKTASGKALLANDTHLQLTIPSPWYLMNLESPTYKAAGVALVGVPLIALGFNGHVAWGATMVMGDNQDLFLEKLKQENGKTFYLDGNKWLPVFELTEMYKIKGKAPVSQNIQFTKRGPLLNQALKNKPLIPLQAARLDGSWGIALRSSVADGDRAPLGFYRLAKAKDISQAQKALSLIDGICLNIVMAEAQKIAWQVTGRYPKRKKGRGLLPSPGYSGEYDWQGYWDFQKNPFLVNPKLGFLATANHRPEKSDIALSSSWYAPERAERAKQLLLVNKKFTVSDMHLMQKDRLSLFALRLKDILLKRAQGSLGAAIEKLSWSDRERAKEALQFYATFDGQLSIDSLPAALHGAFMDVAARAIFADELGYDSEAWRAFLQANVRSYDAVQDHLLQREESPFWDDIKTPEKETKDIILARILAGSIKLLEEKLGKVRANWQWGKLHHYLWQHDIARTVPWLAPLLSRGPYPAGGDRHTLNVASSSWGAGFMVTKIPAMRLVVDFSRPEPAELITHCGNSGNPASPHYDDMIVPFLNVTNHPLPLGKTASEKQYRQVLLLKSSP